MQNETPNCVVIDPGLRFAWAVLNPTCFMRCEQKALFKDVTPEILALQDGQCFVFPTRHTVRFQRVQKDDHAYFTLYPYDPTSSRLYPLEEPERPSEPGLRQRIKDLWDDNNPFEQLRRGGFDSGNN